MSKYDALWESFKRRDEDQIQLAFDEIEQILGFPIDHFFLTFKKELLDYGYQVEKVSMKEKWVKFKRKH